ncbi:MAG: DNA-processing protein DprA [Atribacterales bacterium]
MEDRNFWIAFNHVMGIGPIRFQKLLNVFGDAKTAWRAGVKELSEIIGPGMAQKVEEERKKIEPEKLRERIESKNFKVLTLRDDFYPSLLRNISNPPFLLYMWGDFDFNQLDLFISIVGTRRPTPYGRKITRILASELAKDKWVIVSGLALGIDGEAHSSVVREGGITVGVLGSGLEVIYPSSHRRLAEEIVDGGGAIISEYPPLCPPRPENFPPRNRIISGLTQGVVVVEAPKRSGALITADFALEQGREVMAVPGSIFSPQSEGANNLIAQGAKLLQNKEDILEALGFSSGKAKKSYGEDSPLSGEKGELFSFIDSSGVFKEELLQLTGWEEGKFFRVLLSLELQGLVQESPGGKIFRL